MLVTLLSLCLSHRVYYFDVKTWGELSHGTCFHNLLPFLSVVDVKMEILVLVILLKFKHLELNWF